MAKESGTLQQSGRLVLVATPLGNRNDWSPRARAAVLQADVLFCEDTRSPQRLIDEGETLPPRVSCFAHNEAQRVEALLDYLAAGKTVAFLSEAGMPVVSDPGQLLVDAVWKHGFAIDCIPGPCAATTALCLSGFSATDSRFLGFIARQGSDRSEILRRVVEERGACIFYEAGNRVHELLRDLSAVLDDRETRRLLIARELTKLHQEVRRGTVQELVDVEIDTRGEFTLVLEGYRGAHEMLDRATVQRNGAKEAVAILLDASLRPREKARALAQLSDGDARAIYAALFEKG